jgi:hypothetical protein
MKRNIFWLFAMVLATASLTMLTSCEDDPCADVDCGVGGTCFEGTCICDQGYVSDGMGGCEEDPCFEVDCGDNATCVDGNCVCDDGYEQNNAGDCVLERAKFVGSYQVMDNCSVSGTATYTVTAAGGGSDDMVQISNFWNLFANAVDATISGDTISIALQDPDSDGFTVEGMGVYTDGVIDMDYTIIDTSNGDTDNCASTWTKL